MTKIDLVNANAVMFASSGNIGGVLTVADGVNSYTINLKPEHIGFLGEAFTQWHLINVQIPSGAVSPNALKKGAGKRNRKATLATMRRERRK